MRRQITIGFVLGLLLLSTVFVLGQGSTTPAPKTVLQITVFNKTCSLVEADTSDGTPEATSEAAMASTAEAAATAQATQGVTITYPVLTLGDDCFDVTPLLTVHSNDTLWVAITLPHEVVWQAFSTVTDDPNPPKLDKRGRFVGCENTNVGTQGFCQFLWQSDTTYLIRIPLTVLGEYIAPATHVPATAVISTPVPTLPAEVSATDTGWGSCGSCSTCGGPVEQCVTAPGGVCAWDAATCEHPKHNGS